MDATSPVETPRPCTLRAPFRLRCEFETTPMGVQSPNPLLTWELASSNRGAAPTAFEIVAFARLHWYPGATNPCWTSGKVSSSAQQVLYGKAGGPKEVTPLALHALQRVWWRIRVWDENDVPSDWSEPTWFETGLLCATDWAAAEWITAGDREAAPYFRHQFQVPTDLGSLVHARACLCGLGYGELYVNGNRIGDDQLSPAWTDYDHRQYSDMLYPYSDAGSKRVLYRVHAIDVHSFRGGENVVGIILGNGMHQQRVRTIEGKMSYGPPRLLFLLALTFTGGIIYVTSSPSDAWRWTEGPIISNNVFTGEQYDARLSLPDNWNAPGFDASAWPVAQKAPQPSASVVAQICPSDTIVETLAPVAVAEPEPGRFVLDFGRVISGWLRISVKGAAGTKVTLRFSENIDSQGLPAFLSAGREHIQCDEYTLCGDVTAGEVWEPRFTWHGFRYAEIQGWPDATSGKPSSQNVQARVVYVNSATTASFSCSHPLLEKLVTLFRDTQLVNQHGGVPSDCPHRERLGYTGDAQITAEAVMWNLDVGSLYGKWIADIFDAQHATSGYVPHTVPFYGGGGGPGWGSACIIVPWTYYQFYGDERILRHNYKRMHAWTRYLAAHTDDRGIVTHEEPGSWCLGDWAFPEKAPGSSEKLPHISPEIVNTYY
ncbi:hypothetical protein DB346_01020 [Verrucomicrobia bacterium LW23]|nr:hypothetical protein DB346_01020 [Verrucomicrobia bacterium LW23]